MLTVSIQVDEQRVDPSQLNEFDCGAVHWIGISPLSRADKGLLPLAKWLAQQPGINFQQRQRQGHTPLHKVRNVELESYRKHFIFVKGSNVVYFCASCRQLGVATWI